jgi:hypothetical protein
MSKLEIVPFGKYRGQPVEALAQDREYCEWLSQQDWVRTRYPTIRTLIINHFGEPEETPEHNALEALFVEEDFRRRFVLHVRVDASVSLRPRSGIRIRPLPAGKRKSASTVRVFASTSRRLRTTYSGRPNAKNWCPGVSTGL